VLGGGYDELGSRIIARCTVTRCKAVAFNLIPASFLTSFTFFSDFLGLTCDAFKAKEVMRETPVPSWLVTGSGSSLLVSSCPSTPFSSLSGLLGDLFPFR